MVFARQPGTFALVFDPAGQEAPVTLTSIEGRHFYGHGVFSPDGKLLYATESDFEAAQGVIGVYDATGGYKRIGEFPTYGTGPARIAADARRGDAGDRQWRDRDASRFRRRRTQSVDHGPVGGVRRPAQTATLVGQLRLEAGLHQLSIRHMAIDGRGRVWFGCQFRGAPSQSPQLVGYATHRWRDQADRAAGRYAAGFAQLCGVGGGVGRWRDDRGVVAGGRICWWRSMRKAGTPVLVETLRNGCGLAPDGAGFVATSGMGEWIGIAGAEQERRMFDFEFDNHMLRVG